MTPVQHRIYIGTMIFIIAAVVVGIGIYGWGYYVLPIADRHEHESHSLMSPTGFLGHGMGILGAFLMTFGVAIYSLRKRSKWMANIGSIKHILEFHIFLCLLGPSLIVYHTAFKFGGIVGVSFWCMVIVVSSGVIGRYLYLQIPKTVTGRDITPIELEKKITELRKVLLDTHRVKEEMLQRIDDISKHLIESAQGSLLVTFPKLVVQNIRHDARVFRMIHAFGRPSSEVLDLLNEKAHMQRQLANLTIVQKLFRYWHLFHLPLAIVLLIIMVAHIVTALLFGYGWIFSE